MVPANVKVTAKRLDYYVEIMNRERADKFKLGQDNSNSIEVHPELNCIFSQQLCVFVLVTVIFSKFGREPSNAPIQTAPLAFRVLRANT